MVPANRRFGETNAPPPSQLIARAIEEFIRQHYNQLFTLDKSDLADQIGTLSAQRVREILDGIHLVLNQDVGDWDTRLCYLPTVG
ncbi:MAG: hypothetical protein ACRERD_13655, partial [Candidatus Binatia bacterium]